LKNLFSLHRTPVEKNCSLRRCKIILHVTSSATGIKEVVHLFQNVFSEVEHVGKTSETFFQNFTRKHGLQGFARVVQLFNGYFFLM